jgi:hypothetical protein
VRRSTCATVAAVAATLVFTAAAAGGGASSIQVPITFDLSGATCSQLPATTTIHGMGTGTFSMTPSGEVHSVINGTATDGHGGFWRFNYAQNVHPLGGGSVEVTDHFNLVGSGSPIKLHSHFVADFTSSDLENADLIALKQIHGDPIFCDPI